MSVVEEVPEPHRTVLVEVLGRRKPTLLAELRTKAEATLQELDAVMSEMYRAMAEHYLPGHDLDDRGVAISDAQAAFNNAFMYVNDRER